jgi:hypothetical protein
VLDQFLASSEEWALCALQAMWAKRPIDGPWRMGIPFLLSCLVWIGSDTKLDEVQELEKTADFFIDALTAARHAIQG